MYSVDWPLTAMFVAFVVVLTFILRLISTILPGVSSVTNRTFRELVSKVKNPAAAVFRHLPGSGKLMNGATLGSLDPEIIQKKHESVQL
jgi:hypothetical protein